MPATTPARVAGGRADRDDLRALRGRPQPQRGRKRAAGRPGSRMQTCSSTPCSPRRAERSGRAHGIHTARTPGRTNGKVRVMDPPAAGPRRRKIRKPGASFSRAPRGVRDEFPDSRHRGDGDHRRRVQLPRPDPHQRLADLGGAVVSGRLSGDRSDQPPARPGQGPVGGLRGVRVRRGALPVHLDAADRARIGGRLPACTARRRMALRPPAPPRLVARAARLLDLRLRAGHCPVLQPRLRLQRPSVGDLGTRRLRREGGGGLRDAAPVPAAHGRARFRGEAPPDARCLRPRAPPLDRALRRRGSCPRPSPRS